jgi:hypothetical protein
MSQTHLSRQSMLSKAGNMLAAEIVGCVVVGATLDYLGFNGAFVFVLAALTNLWVAWLLYSVARNQGRSHAYAYGLFSVLGPMAALPVYLALRMLEGVDSAGPRDAA